MRYFPIGAKSDVHVPLRVVEDIEGGSVIELPLAAPIGLRGTVVVDLGWWSTDERDSSATDWARIRGPRRAAWW